MKGSKTTYVQTFSWCMQGISERSEIYCCKTLTGRLSPLVFLPWFSVCALAGNENDGTGKRRPSPSTVTVMTVMTRKWGDFWGRPWRKWWSLHVYLVFRMGGTFTTTNLTPKKTIGKSSSKLFWVRYLCFVFKGWYIQFPGCPTLGSYFFRFGVGLKTLHYKGGFPKNSLLTELFKAYN